jgi:hypothetical protein
MVVLGAGRDLVDLGHLADDRDHRLLVASTPVQSLARGRSSERGYGVTAVQRQTAGGESGWINAVTWIAIIAPLPYSLSRLLWAAGVPLGIDRQLLDDFNTPRVGIAPHRRPGRARRRHSAADTRHRAAPRADCADVDSDHQRQAGPSQAGHRRAPASDRGPDVACAAPDARVWLPHPRRHHRGTGLVALDPGGPRLDLEPLARGCDTRVLARDADATVVRRL